MTTTYTPVCSDWSSVVREALILFDWTCAYCHGRAESGHHAIMKRKKGVKELDVVYNCLPLCNKCHQYADGNDSTKRAWKILCDKHGRDNMVQFLDSVPLKIKPRLSNLEE